MIDNDNQRWQLYCQIANNEPGKEHTELLTVDELKDNDNFVVYKYEDQKRYDTKGNLVASFRDEEGNLMIARTKKQYHELVTAQSGSGKTQCVILNEALCMDGKTSYVFLDVKGEITERAYARAVELYGEENVMIANFMQPDFSTVRISPLAEIAKKVCDARKKGTAELKKVMQWAETESYKFVENCFPLESVKDPTWERVARVFLWSILMALIEDLTLTDRKAKRYGRIRPKPSQINFATVEKVFNCFGGRFFSDRGFFENRPNSSVAKQRSKMVLNNADSTRRNYLGFVEEDLSKYNDPRIISMSSTNTFEVKKMAHTPSVLFLIYDISDTRMREWVNVIFAYEMSKLLSYSHELGGPLPVPVRFMADEFPTLKAHDIYPNILATGRGTNLFMTICVQSLSQLEARYPTEWKTMVENCAIKVFLSTSDCKTAESFIGDLGRTTVPSASHFLAGQYQSEVLPVVTFDKLTHRMKWGESFVCLDRSMPLHGNFEMYYKTPEFLSYPIVKNTEHMMDDCFIDETEFDAPWMDPDFDFDEDDEDEDDEDEFEDIEENDELDELLADLADEEEDDEDDEEEEDDDMDEKITDEALRRREKIKEILSDHRKQDETDEQWKERVNRMIDWFEKIAKEIKGETTASFDVWFIRGPEELTFGAYNALCKHKGILAGEAMEIFDAKEPCLIKDNLSKDEAEKIVRELKADSIFASAISSEDYTKELDYDRTDKADFENACMNIIEQVVGMDHQNRQDAISIVEIILAHVMANCSKKTIAVWERVLHEFHIATDEEYEMLRRSIFS